MNKIIVLTVLTIFLFSILAAVVAAQNEAANRETAAQAGKSVGERISDWWSSSTVQFSDQSKAMVSKLLLLALVVIIVYSIAGFLPFIPPNKDYLNWLIAIIVGILSFLFVSADNIRYIVMNYEALGVMLTSLLPFVVLLTFSYRIRVNNPGMANILNPALFIGFFLYLGSKWLTYRPSADALPELAYVYPLTLVLTVIWLVLERRIWHYFFKKQLMGDMEKFKTMNQVEIGAEMNRLENLKKYVTDPKLVEMLDNREEELANLLK